MSLIYNTKVYVEPDTGPKVASRRVAREKKYSSKSRASAIPSIDMLLDRGMRLHLPEFKNDLELNELRLPFLS